ncbi:MAG: hypothetical protein ABFC34_16465 [Methanobacterium sp.]
MSDKQLVVITVNYLGEPMDSYIRELLTMFFSNFEKPYSDFRNLCHNELKENINTYFDGRKGSYSEQDFLFNILTIISNYYCSFWRFTEAQQFWQDILDIVVEWEQTNKIRIHKGSIFYFWSQVAILQGQFEKGFFLIHSSYEEDVLTHGNKLPGTPAFKTVSLDYSDKKNLLYGLVIEWAKDLEKFIDQYCNITGRTFSKDEFQAKFLNAPPSMDTLFLFTYILAKFFDFDRMPPMLSRGTFTSLYELNSIFDLALIIDNVIYSSLSKPDDNDWKFIKLANHLLIQSGLATDSKININHLVETLKGSEKDFEKTIQKLLDQQYIYSNHVSPTRIECDIALSYCLRNYSAHKIGSFAIIRDRFNEIRQSIFNVLFLAVQTLY